MQISKSLDEVSHTDWADRLKIEYARLEREKADFEQYKKKSGQTLEGIRKKGQRLNEEAKEKDNYQYT